ncbi:MAG: bifunctional phosphopantothenoylcysteine decarboxylase/phosphopantothenate--cysteine ligase CoaBC [Cyclobacteriaceae bacterium]|nr:bifunctional phosphopantothenoylcysteine decarboxylase/phosphopantothenate--cysteine ligase CoaBC [Cyclobacteriaceae bacterium]
MLEQKKILVGVTGSIAAYKAALLVRLLVKEGATVKVLMTRDATTFITPLTLGTLSKNPVLIEFANEQDGTWNNHVELGLWADAFIIAPATANTLAKMANGFCDNLLLATYLSARCPVFFAPAMDLDMLQHAATQNNIKKLLAFGNHLIHATHGELASGLVGEGRLAEPEEIVTTIKDHFTPKRFLNKKVLLTAGPTYEAIDPVRFIGNHSSGKMGFALAETLASQGAQVTLVSGPTHLQSTHKNIRLIKVQNAEEMAATCLTEFTTCNLAILAAAVADYKPLYKAEQKIKKKDENLSIELTKTQDIAATLGKQKKNNQLLIGFALETEQEESNALKKLESKNFDMIVLNSLQHKGAGFGHDTNQISIYLRDKTKIDFQLKNKTEVARDIVNTIVDHLMSDSK